jgi:hypothetical protein
MDARTKKERALIRKYARNIVRVYNEAPEHVRRHAAEWYAVESDALACLAFDLGLSVRAVCGAAAAISPGMRWELVPDYVRALATAADPGSVRVPTYSSEFTARALACLSGADPLEVLGGPKVRAFYALLYTRGQSDSVVIDGHAFNIARGERAPIRGAKVPQAARVTAARYRWAEAAYRAAARLLGLEPHALQAITWTHWRTV